MGKLALIPYLLENVFFITGGRSVHWLFWVSGCQSDSYPRLFEFPPLPKKGGVSFFFFKYPSSLTRRAEDVCSGPRLPRLVRGNSLPRIVRNSVCSHEQNTGRTSGKGRSCGEECGRGDSHGAVPPLPSSSLLSVPSPSSPLSPSPPPSTSPLFPLLGGERPLSRLCRCDSQDVRRHGGRILLFCVFCDVQRREERCSLALRKRGHIGQRHTFLWLVAFVYPDRVQISPMLSMIPEKSMLLVLLATQCPYMRTL